MTRLGRASALLGVFAGDYAILTLINGQLTDFDISAGVCAVALLAAAFSNTASGWAAGSSRMIAQLFGFVWVWKGAQGGHDSRASYRRIEAERRRLSDRSAGWGCGERVSARRIPCKDSTWRPRRSRPIASPHWLAPWISLDSRRSFRR
jgi:glutathione S-transferase